MIPDALDGLMSRLRQIEGMLDRLNAEATPPTPPLTTEGSFEELLAQQIEAGLAPAPATDSAPGPSGLLAAPFSPLAIPEPAAGSDVAALRRGLPSADTARQFYTSGAAPARAGRVPTEIRRLVREASQRYGVDEALVLAVMQTESDFNPRTVSRAGAMGLMQLMPENVTEYGVSDPFDPAQNIDAGVRHLRDMLRAFGGNLELGLAAYNAGPGNVRKYGGIPPFSETRSYVPKVLARMAAFRGEMSLTATEAATAPAAPERVAARTRTTTVPRERPAATDVPALSTRTVPDLPEIEPPSATARGTGAPDRTHPASSPVATDTFATSAPALPADSTPSARPQPQPPVPLTANSPGERPAAESDRSVSDLLTPSSPAPREPVLPRGLESAPPDTAPAEPAARGVATPIAWRPHAEPHAARPAVMTDGPVADAPSEELVEAFQQAVAAVTRRPVEPAPREPEAQPAESVTPHPAPRPPAEPREGEFGQTASSPAVAAVVTPSVREASASRDHERDGREMPTPVRLANRAAPEGATPFSLADVARTSSRAEGSPPARPAVDDLSDVRGLVVERARLIQVPGRDEFTIAVRHPEAGQVSIRIVREAESVQVLMQTGSEGLRRELQSHLPLLQDALEREGLTLGGFELGGHAEPDSGARGHLGVPVRRQGSAGDQETVVPDPAPQVERRSLTGSGLTVWA